MNARAAETALSHNVVDHHLGPWRGGNGLVPGVPMKYWDPCKRGLPSGSSNAQLRLNVLRLDYISCILTILSTVLIGKKLWYGWVVAGANSLIICVIGIRTAQIGFVPANLFCVALYAYNLLSWRRN